MDKHYSIAILNQNIQLDTDGWLHLIPAGEFRTVDGRPEGIPFFYLDGQLAQKVIQEFNSKKLDMVVDYEHQTILSEKNGKPAPAAGWVTELKWVEGSGLYGKVEWTELAKGMIANKEYRYLSPVFCHDDNGHIVSLVHAALTNNPALDSLSEVSAAILTRKRMACSMDFTSFIKLLGLPETASKAEIEAKLLTLSLLMEKKMDFLYHLRRLLDLSDSATEAEIQVALTALVDKLSDGKGIEACTSLPAVVDSYKNTTEMIEKVALSADTIKPDPAKYVEVGVMKTLQDNVAALTQELSALKQKDTESVIQTALSDGRLLPAQKDWAESLAKTNMAALTAFLDTATPVAALTKTQTNGTPPAGVDATAVQLTDSQLAVCKGLGISPEEYKKSLEEK